MRCCLLVLALASCTSASSSNDVVGPFTGEPRRFAIDRISVPRDGSEVDAVADDLDGDGSLDNRIGGITSTLAATSDLSLDAPSMIAAGSLASVLVIEADDVMDDESVGVTYLGADGDAAVAMGGRFVAGAFRSNRTRDTHAPGSARVRLPVFTNADPIVVEVRGLELDLDPDGAGGYDGIVRGALAVEDARAAAYAGLVQMILDEPQRHLSFARVIDADLDGTLTREEADASLIGFLLVPDLQLFDGTRFAPNPAKTTKDSISLAFRIHAVPCASGTCATGAPPDACRDRLRDGSETDVDCGGSCQACQGGGACSAPGDCQTGACDAGHCRAPSCSDTHRDGLETDVDCGHECGPCALGAACAAGGDCASGHCDNAPSALGTCIAPLSLSRS